MRRNESRSRDTSRQILKTERLPNSRSLADVQRGASEPQLRSVFKLIRCSDWFFYSTNEHQVKTYDSPQNHHPDKDEVSSNEMRPRVQTAPGAHNARENSREPNPEDQQKIQRFEKEIGNIQRMLKSFGDQIRIFSPLGSVQTFLSKIL